MRTITKVELEEFRLDINRFVATEENKENLSMLKIYADDRKDLKHILELIKKGNLKRASQRIYKLDSDVKAVIPKSLYDEVMCYYS